MLGAGLAALIVAGRGGESTGQVRRGTLCKPVAVETSKVESFSVREREILALIAAGTTSTEIAEQLNISIHTVKNHRKNMLRKAGCKNSGQLITRCLLMGII